MELNELILSAMISLLSPGKSVYSVVPVGECDAECRKARVCQEDTILCSAPFNLDGHGNTLLRYENAEEGLKRYTVIADAIASESTLAVNSEEYPGTSPELAKYVTTVVFGESGFRRDVHTGRGKFARGDHGRSYCLGQIQLGDSGVTQDGWKGKDLVGSSEERTSRCIKTIVHYLARAKRNCGKWATHTCVFAGYGGLSSNADKDARIRERLAALVKIDNKMKKDQKENP